MNKQWPDDIEKASSAELAACMDLIEQAIAQLQNERRGRRTLGRFAELEMLEARRKAMRDELWRRHSVLKPTRKA